jgi:hypothetical protein
VELDLLLFRWLTVRYRSSLFWHPFRIREKGPLADSHSEFSFLAGYKFASDLLSAAFDNKSNIVAPSYVYVKDSSDLQKEIGQEVDFFSVPVQLGVSYFLLLACHVSLDGTDTVCLA